MMKLFCLLFPSLLSAIALAVDCTKVPAKFDENRIFVNVSVGQDNLPFYTDSGGGLYPYTYEDIANRLGMKIEPNNIDPGPDAPIGFATFPDAFETQGIPMSSIWTSKVRIFRFEKDGKDEASFLRPIMGEGFLGATFFSGHIWHFDYPGQTLLMCHRLENIAGFGQTEMHFRMSQGERQTHQPRIEIEVDNKKIPMLFDTGATSYFSPVAVKMLSISKPFAASSFIRESVAADWEKAHPGWKKIKLGEKFAGGGDLIEVPSVKIGGVQIGPVWFATRKDNIYDKYSAEIMDARIDGAVGGSLFRYLELVADYPAAKLFVRKSKSAPLKN